MFIISSGLFAQGNVLQINSPTPGELVSTSFLPIDYNLAGYFDIGDSACTDCDGFIRVTLNYAYAAAFTSVGPDTLQDVTNELSGSRADIARSALWRAIDSEELAA